MSHPERETVRVRTDRRPARRSRREGLDRQQRLRWIALLMAGSLVAAWSLATSRPARAGDEARTFGAPTVLSARGQRLKVMVPLTELPAERTSAAAFHVENSQASAGHDAPTPGGFTVMRPVRSSYVVFQSEEVIDAPAVSLTFTVAGDPKSPYLMDLVIPEASFGQPVPLARVAAVGRDAGVSGIGFRRIDGPAPRADLPPK